MQKEYEAMLTENREVGEYRNRCIGGPADNYETIMKHKLYQHGNKSFPSMRLQNSKKVCRLIQWTVNNHVQKCFRALSIFDRILLIFR